MNSAYDGQSLQSYGLRLQTEARRAGARPSARPVARAIAPRLRALVSRRSH